MRDISYAYAVGSLMYCKPCPCPDIILAVRMVGRNEKNPGFELDCYKEQKTILSHIGIWIASK